MKLSQKLEIKMSEIRQAVIDLPATATPADTEALRAQLSTATAEHRAALQSEFKQMDAVGAGAGETAEVRAMLERGNVGNIFDSALHSRPISGAEAELQAHYGVGANSVPLAMLGGWGGCHHRRRGWRNGRLRRAVVWGFPGGVCQWAD